MKAFLSKNYLLLLLAGFALIWFANLQYRNLIKPDEGRYAEISREMVQSGDWVTPRLNGLKYFEKPPLQYWVTAIAYSVFGAHEWTARLWTGLTGFFGVLLIYATGRRIYGQQAGLFAALILACSLLYAGIGHMNSLDMGVTFFMSAGLCALLLAQQTQISARAQKILILLSFAALALAVLSKGLIGIVLPAAVVFIYSVVQRDFAWWKRLYIGWGLLLFFAIVSPWFILVARANPEFLHFFFIYEHYERFLYKAHGRFQPWWWFIPVFMLGIMPWLLVCLDALKDNSIKAWRAVFQKSAQEKKPFNVELFLLIWVAFIFVFFSKSDSKLASYILPIFSALALLMGAHLNKISPRRAFYLLSPALILPVALGWISFSTGLVGYTTEVFEPAFYAQYARVIIAVAMVCSLLLIAGLYFLYGQKMQRGLVLISFASLLFAQGLITGHETLSPLSSSKLLAQQIKPFDDGVQPFYSVLMYDHTLNFYLNRTTTLVAYEDEMAFGIKQQPELYLPTLEAFAQRWRAQKNALGIIPAGVFAHLQALNLPLEIIARNELFIVFKKI